MSKQIAVFDSGVGGISTLKEMEKLMPAEDFVYYADNLNAPYGVRSHDEIRLLALRSMDKIAAANPKAIVVACNTVTEVCIGDIRRAYPDVPVFGLQPAVKPAPKRTLVLVTEATASSAAFREFVARHDGAYVFPLAEAAGMIERGESDGKLTEYLAERFSGINKAEFSSAVLGCTHYVLKKRCFAAALGLPLYDGNAGLARHVAGALAVKNLLARGRQKGGVRINLSDCSTSEFAKYAAFCGGCAT